MADTEEQAVQYHPKDAIGSAVKATLVTGSAGLFISTIQNTLTKQNVGAFGVFTRTGGTFAVFGWWKMQKLGKPRRETPRYVDAALVSYTCEHELIYDRVTAAMGGAYEFSKCASANLREVDDTYNSFIGGALGGAMLGLRFRSAPAVLGYGAALGVILSAFTFTGGQLNGYKQDSTVDEVARKEYLRKNRRRPIEETVNELGEGRGIYAPGYEQRRADRLKERYGVDVPVSAPAA
nr:hypothetical protein B0A51_13025 [Rachicladosporium sp. CCFEE 5018]